MGKGVGKHEESPTLSQNFMNFGTQTAQNRTGVLPALAISFFPSPSHTLYAGLTWRPTATLGEMALGSFAANEGPKDVKSEMLSRRAALSGNTSL